VILNLDLIDFAGTLRTVWPDDRITAKVINCSLDAHNHNGFSMDYQGLAPSDVTLLAAPDAAVPALLEAIEARGRRDLPSQVAERPPGAERVAPQSAGSITLRDLAGHFAVAAAGGQVCLIRLPFGWPSDGFDLKGPLDYLGRDGGAGVGSAPGIAVGAALALRGSGRLPVAIIGDGEYVMGLTALWTAARYRIPLLVIVANNRSFFNDEIHQERMALARGRPVENKWIGMRMDDPPLDLAGLARDQGLEGIGPVTDCRDLPAALTEGVAAVGHGRAMVIDVLVTPGER
jgi:thiamine pyrophosphate-dependent acetolactate synthase large subunit-like protein